MKFTCLYFWLGILSVFFLTKPAKAQGSWGWEEVTDNSRIPADAFYYGTPDNRSYACGMWHEDAFYNGKVSNQNCSFVHKGRAVHVKKFWVLRGPRLRWIDFYKEDQIPESAIFNALDLSKKVHVCAVLFRNEYNVGYVWRQRCYIAWGNDMFYFGYYSLAVSDD